MSHAEESCPGVLWQKLRFLPQPATPGFNPAGWSSEQYSSYVESTIPNGTAVNILLFSIAFAFLLLLLLWRLFRCNSARKSLLAHKVIHDPWLHGHKVAYAFFACGCIVLAVAGLVTLPRPYTQVGDLATRLETASGFANLLLEALDDLLGSGSNIRRPMIQTDTAIQDIVQTLGNDTQCVARVLDALPVLVMQSQLAAAKALTVGLSQSLANASALINSAVAPAPIGATASFTELARMPALLTNMNNTLAAYDSALAALPASRQPTSVSDLRVNELRAAQRAFNLTWCINALDVLSDSLRTIIAVDKEKRYIQACDAVRVVQDVILASTPLMNNLTVSLKALDTVFLGTQQQQQQQQPGAIVAGRACMLSLVKELAEFDSSMFRFNTTLERSAIETTLILARALEGIYGNNNTLTDAMDVHAGAVASGSSAGTRMQFPRPLSNVTLQQTKVLTWLVDFNITKFHIWCNVVQNASVLGFAGYFIDAEQFQPYIATFRSALVALQQPAGNVQAALTAYGNNPSDMSYSALLTALSTARPALANARNAHNNKIGANGRRIEGDIRFAAFCANRTVTRATEDPWMYFLLDNEEEPPPYYTSWSLVWALDARLVALAGNITTAIKWLASDGGPATLFRTTSQLAVMQDALFQAQALLNRTGWGRRASSPAPSGLSLPQVTFMQPLLMSVQLLSTTLSSGMVAAAEQLDNALGKVLVAAPSPPLPKPTPAALIRHQLQQRYNVTSNTTTNITTNVNANITANITADANANVTTVLRRQLVRWLDDLTVTLRGKRVRRYADAGYWAVMAAYATLIVTCLAVGAALYVNCPGGLAVGLVVLLLLATVIMAGAWVAAAGMVVVSDTCGNMYSLVPSKMSPSSPLFQLVGYYLQGNGGTLANVLRTTGLGDTTRLAAAIDTLQAQVLNPLLLPHPPDPVTFAANSTSPWPGSLGRVQYTLGAMLLDLAALMADMSGKLTTLLSLADRAAVLEQYDHVMSWACCGMGEQLLVVWVCTTGCGLLTCLAALSGALVLKKLDDMMPLHARSVWTCYDPRDFPRPVRRRRYSHNNNYHNYSSGDGSFN